MSKRNERNAGVRRAEQQSKTGAAQRYHPQYFLPESYRISRDVFSHWIRFMLGGDARCHWGSHNGMKGHIYSAQRELTPAEIEDLQRFTMQYESNPEDYANQMIYRDAQGDDNLTRTDRYQEFSGQAQRYLGGCYPESMSARDMKGASSLSGAAQTIYAQSAQGKQAYNDSRNAPDSRWYDKSDQPIPWTSTTQPGPSAQAQSARSVYPGSEPWNASSQAYGSLPYPTNKGVYPEVGPDRPYGTQGSGYPYEVQSGSQAMNSAPGQYPSKDSMTFGSSQPMTYNINPQNASYMQNPYQAYGNRNDAYKNSSTMDTQSPGGQASFQQFASRADTYPSSSMMDTRSGSKVTDGSTGDDGSGRSYHVGSPRNDASGSRRIKKEQGSPPA